MNQNLLLQSSLAQELYAEVKELPIVDYHCHLDPGAIAQDQPFETLGGMWLAHDHYKWRLMRAGGVSEDYITGGRSDREKFDAYARVLSLAAGSPLYHWTQMELSQYFGVETPLTPQSAPQIWEQANEKIRSERLSPRKLIDRSRVVYIATTDDPADSLNQHMKLKNDPSFSCRVTPSFRTDRVLSLWQQDYGGYINTLSEAAEVEVKDLTSLKDALIKRLDFFKKMGCRFSDVGIPAFPDRIAGEAEARQTFAKALSGKPIGEAERSGFLGYMYVFLGAEYKSRDIVMQLHMAVRRNVNTRLYQAAGPDAGGDCIDDVIRVGALLALLDRMDQADGLPESILYALNPAMLPALCAAAGSFSGVRCGAAWWFCDHKRGILEVLKTVAEYSSLATFPGMLTDSRSFLSYARHDYYRRIVCSLLAEWVNLGELEPDAAATLSRRLCYDNTKALVEGSRQGKGSL